MVGNIYNEDCLDTMKRMTNNYCDLVVTSPPYNLNLVSGLKNKYDGNYHDNLATQEYYEWNVIILKELMRVSKLVIWNIQYIAGNSKALLQYMSDLRYNIREIMIWHKYPSQPAMGEYVLNSDFEFILFFDKDGGGRRIEQATFERGKLSNVIKSLRHIGNPQELYGVEHRAVMPLNLASLLVNNYSIRGNIIYDPFAGVGTVPVAAATYGRQYIGSEIDTNVCNAARRRLELVQAQETMF